MSSTVGTPGTPNTLTSSTPHPSAPGIADLAQSLTCAVLTAPEHTAAYTRDASMLTPDGAPLAVVLPETTDQVAHTLAWAHAYRVPVSIRGGGTGLAGGAVSYQDGIVLAFDRMNKILAIDPENKLADVQPGLITADLDAAAREHGLFFAPDPASATTSTVGGNIATNAGGLRCLAHGVTLEAVAALEVVLANGDIIHTGSRTIKNVSGYNLTQLFVGSEGTLGVITAATVRLKKAPSGTPYTFSAHFDAVHDAAAAVLAIADQATPEALEFMDAQTVAAVEKHHGRGLSIPGAAMLVGQCVGQDAAAQAEQISLLCRDLGARQSAIAAGQELMDSRRLVQSAMVAEGVEVFGDVGVPLSKLPEMVQRVHEISERTGKRVFIVAHAGDGNLHPSVESGTTAQEYEQGMQVLDQIVEAALELGGTITGEHGVGAVKRHELGLQYSPQTLAAQHAIKAALDPRGILTPNRAI